MKTINRLHLILSCLVALMICLPTKSVARNSNELSDSIFYDLAMYREMLNDYKVKKGNNNLKTSADSSLLILSYYPWRAVFDSRAVHRVSVYDDGIYILMELIETTNDTIQRELYLDELMNVYDVWYENADTINKQIDIPFSKTLILSEKARRYVQDCMPLVYGVKGDSIKKENVMEPFAVRAYNLLRDALYEQEHKEDLHINIPGLYFKWAQASIAYYGANKNIKAFEKQYHADFDTVDVRFGDLMAMEAIDDRIRRGNVRKNYDAIKKQYNKTCNDMELSGATNWREFEPIYRDQLIEKRELWDYCIEEPDADFLDRVIRDLKKGRDSSEVYVEALECYIEYIVPKPAKGESIAEDKAEEYLNKRELLLAVNIKRKRYDDAVALIPDMIAVEKDNIKDAFLWYRWGMILREQKNSQAVYRFKRAIECYPDFGDAYYYLASEYFNCKYKSPSGDESYDRYKYLLCIDKLELAKSCVMKFGGTEYNRIAIEDIDEFIDICKKNCPDKEGDVFFQGYDKEGTKFEFNWKGPMQGETTTMRFY